MGCSACGAETTTYECQDCLTEKCRGCGLRSGDGNAQVVEPDTGYYICAACQCGCAKCTSDG